MYAIPALGIESRKRSNSGSSLAPWPTWVWTSISQRQSGEWQCGKIFSLDDPKKCKQDHTQITLRPYLPHSRWATIHSRVTPRLNHLLCSHQLYLFSQSHNCHVSQSYWQANKSAWAHTEEKLFHLCAEDTCQGHHHCGAQKNLGWVQMPANREQSRMPSNYMTVTEGSVTVGNAQNTGQMQLWMKFRKPGRRTRQRIWGSLSWCIQRRLGH